MLHAKTIWASSGLRGANWILWMDWVRRDSFGLLVGLVRQLEEACLPLPPPHYWHTDTPPARGARQIRPAAPKVNEAQDEPENYTRGVNQDERNIVRFLWASSIGLGSELGQWESEERTNMKMKIWLCSIWWVEQSFGIKRTNSKCHVNVTFLCAKLNLSSTIWGSCTLGRIPLTNRMNFWKNSKRPLTPPQFW